MDIIKKAIVFDGQAIVSVIDTKEIAQQESDIHGFSTPVANAMARLLTVGSFISGNFKNQGDKLTIIISSDGPIEKMVVCGDYGAKVRGYCAVPKALEGFENVSVNKVIGKGQLQVIEDLGLKEPYNGLVELVNGNISSDFAYYFATSEQINSAIALGSEFKDGKCLASGGIIIQAMPGCRDEILVILEDIVSQLTDVAKLFKEKSASEILDYYFGHFDIQYMDDIKPKLECSCSRARFAGALMTMGKDQVMSILEQEGKIEAKCDFCQTKYEFNKEELTQLFEND